MIDEQLIDEVAQHGVIFNRQKYYLNGSGCAGGAGGGGSGAAGVGQGKYETKDDAWQIIAMKLRTDVETCKKRWKYLRERYVSQRKQGDPPVYEHLSRPYLEKMKFLDQHIQPRKSYRNVPNFLTSPHSSHNNNNSSSNYGDYNMDTKSNGSMKCMQYPHYQDQHAMNALSSAAAAASAMENGNGLVKTEADQVFRDFAAAVASQQLQQMSQTQASTSHHHHHHHQAVAAAAAMAASTQNYQDQFRENGSVTTAVNSQNGAAAASSSSSLSLKSPLSSPLQTANNAAAHSTPRQGTITPAATSQLQTHTYNDGNINDDLDSTSTGSNFNTKKARVHLNAGTPMHSTNAHALHSSNASANSHFADNSDDDSDDNSSMLQSLNDHHENNNSSNHHYNATASNAVMQRNAVASNNVLNNSGGSSNNNNSHQQQQQQQPQSMFPANADFLFQLYQTLPQQTQQQHHQQQHPHQQNANKFQMPQAPQRSSEHLLGELVTTELLKMSKERRKNVQKRILEILFFDD